MWINLSNSMLNSDMSCIGRWNEPATFPVTTLILPFYYYYVLGHSGLVKFLS